ncbi:hypothetical protein FAIPA1_170036 [Frankia sp. AiPs1]|uniref:enoyl-CoA hydratase-related protein n=1 Tax=Frankia sp. AiPa1 TaxID=573492 RepID=UPI00202AF197|nr:enoyl-CoA hydratase-related protein [Frankia sp. AiPa1]MCL9761711.1 enoyl-CoA hydratase-related protein [Frankia sp. AiPa1]
MSGDGGAGSGAPSLVLVEVADRVATVTLNRPAVRNVLSRALMAGLWDAMVALGADDEVDAVVLTGADPAFCAGIDLREISGETPSDAERRATDAGQGGTGTDSGRLGNGASVTPVQDPVGLHRFLPVIDKPVIGAVDEAHALEGLLSATWRPGTSQVADRRADVIRRGRTQLDP